MNTLEIIFVGLIAFLGVGNDPRTVIVLDISRGENMRGHHIQPHEAVIRVAEADVVKQENWPWTTDRGYRHYPLDGRKLSFAGIDEEQPFEAQPSHNCFVPHLTTECPELGAVKKTEVLEEESAANLRLEHGTLEAICSRDGAVASRYRVRTTGEVLIVAGRADTPQRVLWLKPNAKIEIRNEPTGTEAVMNHFLAYYKKMAVENVGCTNLPFTRLKACGQCPTEGRIVSTVACSNSNYP